jgi:photosystem II stability/assembly factor-like uncharacterized protein
MRRSLLWTGGLAVLLAVGTLRVPAQVTAPAPAVTADAEYAREAYDAYRAMRESSPYRTLSWQYLGPTNVSGRATDIAVADTQSGRRIYAAYASSGVWKTDDDGASWQAIFEDQPSTSIGDVAVAPSNPDIVWVGTGESNLYRASMPGMGVFKSIDGGRTFLHSGLTDTQTVARIIVHPANPDVVYVASAGHEWTDNEMRGVFKTTDGGKTWKKVLYRSPRTGAIDLVMDPSDPDVLYAAMWQRVRRKWSDPRVEPGYDESGIWKSTDGGDTWSETSNGLPPAEFRGRTGIDVSLSNPNVLYAFVDNYEPGRPARPGERDPYGRPISESRIKAAEIYRSDDKGRTWRKASASSDVLTRLSATYGWVFGQIRVDPVDENTVYVLGVTLTVSRDGGRTFDVIRGTHGDHHALWIDPGQPSILYDANDGGVNMTRNGGRTWTHAVSAGGTQFYDVALDTATPTHAYGSIQDDGSRRGAIDVTRGRGSVPAVAWESAPGGEGSHHAIDPANPDIVYSHGFYGNFTREDLSVSRAAKGKNAAQARRDDDDEEAGQKPGPGVTNIRPRQSAGGPELRAQWMAPILVSAFDPATLYAAYQMVFRSANRGDKWRAISGDLTGNDPSKMLRGSSSEIPYQTIVALAESPLLKGLLYAGTDDGRLHVTRDGGATWTELTEGLGVRKWISSVVPSLHDGATVFVTARGREDDDFGVYVWKSTDYGRTFKSIASNVPSGSVNVIREDPRAASASRLYIGTDSGVLVSNDGGEQWRVLGGNLPSVQVSDIEYDGRDGLLVLATYGRGVWVMDASAIR